MRVDRSLPRCRRKSPRRANWRPQPSTRSSGSWRARYRARAGHGARIAPTIIVAAVWPITCCRRRAATVYTLATVALRDARRRADAVGAARTAVGRTAPCRAQLRRGPGVLPAGRAPSRRATTAHGRLGRQRRLWRGGSSDALAPLDRRRCASVRVDSRAIRPGTRSNGSSA